VPANALVDASDWARIEKRLKRRKNRVYALWFFLALSVCTTSALFFSNSINTEKGPTIATQEIIKNNINTVLESQDSELNSATEHSEITVNQRESSISTLSGYQKSTKQISDKITKPKYTSQIPSSEVNTEPLNTSTILPPYTTSTNVIVGSTLSAKNTSIYKPAIHGNYPKWITIPRVVIPSKINSKKSNISYDQAHWESGVSFTPSLSSKITGINKDLSGLINKNYDSKVASSESSTFANTYGFNAQYHPTGRFFYSSGLFLTKRSEQLEYDYLITTGTVLDLNTNTIVDYPSLNPLLYKEVTYSGSNSYHFIEIPLNIGYKLPLSRNFELRTQVGVSYMTLLNTSGKKGNFTTLELENLSSLNFNKHHIATNLKSGIYYHRPKVTIGLEPMLGMNLTNLQTKSSSAVLDKPYSYGINLTTNLKLFKK
jgi:hypothetical protein